MIDWTNAQSIIEAIGIERVEAEKIVRDIKKLNRDLIQFNKTALLIDKIESLNGKGRDSSYWSGEPEH